MHIHGIIHSVSECQSDESAEFGIFCTKLVAMATSFEISEKEVQIDHLHRESFHSVKTLRKSVQLICLREIIKKKVKKEKETEKCMAKPNI